MQIIYEACCNDISSHRLNRVISYRKVSCTRLSLDRHLIAGRETLRSNNESDARQCCVHLIHQIDTDFVALRLQSACIEADTREAESLEPPMPVFDFVCSVLQLNRLLSYSRQADAWSPITRPISNIDQTSIWRPSSRLKCSEDFARCLKTIIYHIMFAANKDEWDVPWKSILSRESAHPTQSFG